MHNFLNKLILSGIALDWKFSMAFGDVAVTVDIVGLDRKPIRFTAEILDGKLVLSGKKTLPDWEEVEGIEVRLCR